MGRLEDETKQSPSPLEYKNIFLLLSREPPKTILILHASLSSLSIFCLDVSLLPLSFVLMFHFEGHSCHLT